ncbi:hypothetical protein TNCT_370331 [Trichonephila clavata]|uniref:Uncharacterized protein n=1 Tax=Trichonephila clavata TaxID=2740835 RepID=A0A8X6KPF2_TRICU|nr:hypothetical protein TNCT_370331 [Trichonephila clavata]
MAREELFLPHQTCASLYGVMLSSRSENPGGPVRDPHPRTLRRRPTKCAKRCPRTRQALRLHHPRILCPVSQRRECYRTLYPNSEGSFLLELSYPWLPIVRARTTGNDSRALDSLNYADDPNGR